MRLIDADALERKITEEKDSFVAHDPYNTGYNNGLAMAHAMVVTTPAIDAVPVVRCKDCKYCGQFPYATTTDMRCQCRDMYWYPTNPDDFCSYGERREDGEDNG